MIAAYEFEKTVIHLGSFIAFIILFSIAQWTAESSEDIAR